MLDILRGFGIMVLFYIAGAAVLLIIRKLFKPSAEMFRKLLHILCFVAIFPWLHLFAVWYHAAIAILMFSALVFLLLHLPWFKAIFPEREDNEVEKSQATVFLVMVILITVYWGVLGESWKFIIPTALMAHGFGDAAAALGGKAYGRHKIGWKYVDHKKTWEGSATMFVVSAIVSLIILSIYQVAVFGNILIAALVVAAVSTLAEMLSHKGSDTFIVPLSSALALYLLMLVL